MLTRKPTIVAERIMEKMGYQSGFDVGKSFQGSSELLSVTAKLDHAGIDYLLFFVGGESLMILPPR